MKESNKRKISKQEIAKAINIYRYILPFKWHFIVGLICLVASTAVVSVIPMGFRELVDAANRNNMGADKLKEIGFLLGITLLIQAFFSFFRIYLFEYVSQNAMASIRSDVYKKIITQPIFFFESRRVGELTSRITNDVSQLQESLSMNLAMLVRQMVLPIVCIPFLLKISVTLTIWMLAVIPIMVVATVFFGRFIKRISKQAQDNLAETNVIVEETFQGIDVVKAFTNEKFETERYNNLNNNVVKTFIHASKFRASFVSFIIFSMFGAIVLIVTKGLSIVAANELTIGQLIEFLLYTIFIGGSLSGLSESYSVIQKTVGASERVQEILSLEEEVNTNLPNKKLSVDGSLKFKNLSFSYPSRPDHLILDDVSFEIKAGQKIALVGPSGSGKSTIIKLVSKLYENYTGEITTNIGSLSSINVSDWRSLIGTVPQETMLFGGSIKENIAYGKIGCTDKEIEEAAQKAYAMDFIATFPDKLETLVGERGIKLSGGQRQRIAIARAILRDPKILLLDEATSALDSESELLVKKALADLMKNRTTIIIAHRLSTIREADKILVMNKGKIEEEGTHQELSSLPNGLYNYLLKLQYSE
jgi:ABC-type multidrug transport system fused ATPase/permease subunit